MNPDPLYVEETDDEPWPIPSEPARRRGWVLVTVALVVAAVALALVRR